VSAFTTGICAHKVRRTAQATKQERVEENGYVIHRRALLREQAG
jgi:hypothetical protein